ncbi:von Willebrand factor, type A [Candidatus Sulfopaludibacter sp. SbA3]|nr:von Willebrand factor, type A [Candidatus Sulfopaludibacter sp. SbA3]
MAGAASCFFRLRARACQQEPQEFVIHSDVRLVLLDVSVKDRHGGFVSNLAQDNFTVLENGEPQRITVFANEDIPVTVGILVDESRSMLAKRNDVIAAAGAFIQTSNPQDEIFVLNFNDSVQRGLPDQQLFSDNAQQLRAALYRGVPSGRTALNDAIVEGLRQLASGSRGKKALVVISDGGDNASRHTGAQMFALVERSIATVYTIGLFDADDPDRNPGILKRLANWSGGEAWFPKSPADMTTVCQGVAGEIRTRYTIGYLPALDNHGSLRHIQVRVSAPGRSFLIARTRTRYRYEEIANPGSK